MSAQPMALEFPPLPPYVGTARLFAAAVARHFGADEDAVEDLKVAVSEACTSAIRIRVGEASGAPVRLSISTSERGLVIDVPRAFPVESAEAESTTEDLVRTLGLEVIQALFPEVERLSTSGEASGVRFALSLP